MKKDFYNNSIKKIFTESKIIVDIGGGLRISKEKGNRFSKNTAWIEPLLTEVDYKIMDPVSTYSPDIIGDIHAMPFLDNHIDAIFCLSVLEHVENPLKAAEEMYRVLKPGGYCFVYVPFLYYYHAEKGYYKDFWRFTEDSIVYMFRSFSQCTIQQTRGALETWVKLSPIGRFRFVLRFSRILDKIMGKEKSKQTSGYNVFLVK